MKEAALKQALEFIDSWLEFRYGRLEIPGFTVAVSHKGKVLLSRAYGFADLEKQTPMTTDHIFRIASHSKTFTATAIMQLQEQGKLKLDDTVIQYVPWLSEHTDKRWESVTIRQLLSHSAGVIRDGLDCDYWSVERPFPDAEEFKSELLKAELVYDNNTTMKYSNYGFTLLGQVVENVAGTPYNDYVIEHIVKPLGLDGTGPEYTEAIDGRLVTGYSRRDVDKQRLPIDVVDTRAMSAATGFYSTVGDLCKYTTAHYPNSDQLLTTASKREMQRIAWKVANTTEDEAYGLGFEIEKVDERNMVGHGGGFPGNITYTLFDPKDEFTVTALTNAIDGPAGSMVKAIVRVIDWFQKNYVEKPERDLTKFNGRYMNIFSISEIVTYGDTIVSISPDSWEPFKEPEELEYVDDSTLKTTKANGYYSAGELAHFTFDEDKVTKIVDAGATMLPEKAFLEKMAEKKKISLDS